MSSIENQPKISSGTQLASSLLAEESGLYKPCFKNFPHWIMLLLLWSALSQNLLFTSAHACLLVSLQGTIDITGNGGGSLSQGDGIYLHTYKYTRTRSGSFWINYQGCYSALQQYNFSGRDAHEDHWNYIHYDDNGDIIITPCHGFGKDTMLNAPVSLVNAGIYFDPIDPRRSYSLFMSAVWLHANYTGIIKPLICGGSGNDIHIVRWDSLYNGDNGSLIADEVPLPPNWLSQPNLPLTGEKSWTTFEAYDSGIPYIHINWKAKWNLLRKEQIIDDPCKYPGGSVIDCENQSLSEDVEIIGTPFALHYQSDRVAGRTSANPTAKTHAREFGGWTLSIHHRYNRTTNALYLGNGDRRDITGLGPPISVLPSNGSIVANSAVASATLGNFLVGSTDASEVYEFASDGRHLRTLQFLTGASLYTFSYDAQKRLVGITDGDGNVTTIDRDSEGHPTAIIGPYGQTTVLTVNGNGYLASITNPANETVKLVSTAKGLLIRYTNAKNQVSTHAYDADGRLLRDTDAVGGLQKLARTESDTDFTVKRSSGLGHTTQYQVTPAAEGGEKRVITDPAGLKTKLTRDASGNKSAIRPDGTETTKTIADDPRFLRSAAFVRKASITTPGGLNFVSGTDRTVNLTNRKDPFSFTESTETSNVNNRTYTSIFNRASLAYTSTTPEGRKSQNFIDALGRPLQTSIDGLLPVARSYDAQGRLATLSQGSGTSARTAQFGYGSDGYLKQLTDPLGRMRGFTYDAAGRITQETLPGARTVSYAYDVEGNVIAVTPPGKTAHLFDYTPVGLLSAYTAPKVGTEANQTLYRYNLDRQLTGVTYPDGKTVALTYDTAGRQKTLSFARGTLTNSYDAMTGNLKSVSAPGGIGLAYAYDGALLTAASWTGPITGGVQWAYDNDFRIKELKVNGNDAIAFAYDKDSLLTDAGALSLSHSAQNGLRTGSTLDNVTDNIVYDGFGEPRSYQASFLGSLIYVNTYTYDRLGRIATRTETIGGVTERFVYAYDTAGRLWKVAKNGTPISTYAYDSNGNRLSLTQPSGRLIGVYDAQDRLTRYGTAAYTYTANGELTSKTEGGQQTLYNYDKLGNLVSAKLPGGTTITYLIDGQNRRIGKKINGVLRQGFLYQDQLKPIAELDAHNNVVSRFVYATHANVPDYLIKDNQRYRIVTDQLGSPRLVVNTADGTVAQRMDYDEFGNVIRDTNPGFQPFGFAGGLYDRDTGLVRFGVRDYDAEIGRWSVKDPILFSAGSSNIYSYAHMNPINISDINGFYENKETIDNILKNANPFSHGLCLNYVINAIRGLKPGKDSNGKPFNPTGAPSAYRAGDILALYNYFSVKETAQSTLQPGDIFVFPATGKTFPGTNIVDVHGHIEIWTGTNFVSDFIQSRFLANTFIWSTSTPSQYRHISNVAACEKGPSICQ